MNTTTNNATVITETIGNLNIHTTVSMYDKKGYGITELFNVVGHMPAPGKVHDNHRDYADDDLAAIAGFGVTEDNEVVALFNSRYFSLNSVYVGKNDNETHLSCWSTGGVVKPMYTGGNIERAIQKYNAEIDAARAEVGYECGTKLIAWTLI